MSSLKVVEDVQANLRAFLQDLDSPVAYYDTINLQATIVEDLWVSASFSAYDAESNCYAGGSVRESGSIEVQVFSESGKGTNTARALADSIATYYRQNPRPGSDVVIERVTPPNELFLGDARRWYGVGVSLEYDYFT